MAWCSVCWSLPGSRHAPVVGMQPVESVGVPVGPVPGVPGKRGRSLRVELELASGKAGFTQIGQMTVSRG